MPGDNDVSRASPNEAPPTESACDELSARVQVALDRTRQKLEAPGAWLGIDTPACATHVWVSGEASPGHPLEPEHLFRAGSVTKTFTAAAVLSLVDDGALELDSPATDVLPEITDGGITVRMLLDHRSGLFEYTEDATFALGASHDPKREYTPEELLAAGLRNDAYFAPGSGWRYSNTNYIALGIIVERVTGRTFSDVLRSGFLEPLGLKDTALEGDEPMPGELARGFSRDGKTDVTDAYTLSWAWSAGALASSAEDLTRWGARLYGGTVLSPGTQDAMTAARPIGVPGMRYGLGMFELSPPLTPALMVGHGGDISGFATVMFALPTQKVSLMAAATRTGVDPEEILVAALDVLFPEGVE